MNSNTASVVSRQVSRHNAAPIMWRAIPILCFLLLTFAAFAEERAEETSGVKDEPVLIEEKESTLRNLLSVPFEIPPALVRAAGAPLNSFANWVEGTNFPLRVANFFSNDERTAFWYPMFRFGGGGGGFYGLGASHANLFGYGYKGSAYFMLSPKLDSDAKLNFSNPNLVGTEISAGLSTVWRRRYNDRFYGIGNETSSNYASYDSRGLFVTLPVAGRIDDHVRWKVFGRFHSLEQRNDPDNPFSVLFTPTQSPGLDEHVLGGEFGVSLSADTRDEGGTPGSGVAAKAMVSRFQGTDGFHFFRSRLALTKFLTIFREGRVLALGGRLETVHAPWGGAVPFSVLPHLGGTSNLRAYRTLRFRDEVAVIAIVEYRYPLWRMSDGLIFYEAGRVGNNFDDLAIKGFHQSYGGGFRFRTRTNFFFQVQLAHGADGLLFSVAFNQSL